MNQFLAGEIEGDPGKWSSRSYRNWLRSSVALAASFYMLAGPIPAQNAPPVASPADIAKLVSTYGLAAVRAASEGGQVVNLPSSLPLGQQSPAIERMLQDVGEIQGHYAAVSSDIRALKAGVDLVSGGVALVSGPGGAAAATILGATAGYGMEKGRQAIADQASQDVAALLVVHADLIRRDLQMELGQFTEALQDPTRREEVRAVLLTNQTLFADLRARVAGNPAADRAVIDMIIAGGQDLDIAQTDQILAQAGRIEDIESRIGNLGSKLATFEKETRGRFERVDAEIASLGGAVETLGQRFTELDGRVASLEAGQAVVIDFMFDQMPAEAKVRLLEAGHLRDSIVCPATDAACDPAVVHASLIETYRAQAEVDEIIGDIQSVTSVMKDIDTIAQNLNIPLPKEFQQAYGLANVAIGALSATNPLGMMAALSGVAGIFGGGGSSAEAQRHAEMMAFLDKRFDEIDQQLINIIENQKITLDAINQVSRQIEAGFVRMDQRLISMAYEQQRIAGGITRLIWQDWQSCYRVYAISRREGHVEPFSLDFRTESNLRAVVEATQPSGAVDCLTVMQDAFEAEANPSLFGSFASLSAAMTSADPLPDDLRAAEAADGGEGVVQDRSAVRLELPDFRSSMETFETDVFNKAYGRLAVFSSEQLDGRVADAFVLLARPVTTTDDWRAELAGIQTEPLSCSEAAEHPEARHCELLEPAGGSNGDRTIIDQHAAELLSKPILSDLVTDVMPWVHVIAQIADRYDSGSPTGWLYLDEVANGLAAQQPVVNTDKSKSLGRRLVESAIRAVDIAIASSAMTYGPLSAQQALSELKAGRDRGALISDLVANPFLARNLGQFLLEEYHQAAHGTLRAPEATYRSAYEAALVGSTESVRFRLLSALFRTPQSPDLVFHVTETGAPGVVIFADLNNLSDPRNIVIPLPPPGSYADGRIAMPQSYFDLLASRNSLVDRLIGYSVFDDIPDSVAADLIAVLLSGK